MDDRLQKFAALVEAGSFTKAAQNLHVSQPALSVAIDKLERAMKTQLVQSAGKHGVTLTKAGQLVYTAALEHRAVEHNLRQQLVSTSQQKPQLRIGMIDNVASLLTATDEPLSSLEKESELSLFVSNSTSLRTALQADRLDIAIVVADDETDTRMQVLATGSDHLVLVCASSVQQSFQRLIDTGEQVPFISYVQSSKTHQLVAVALQTARLKTHVVLSSTSPDVMLRTVLRGRGAAILPKNLVSAQLASGALSSLEVREKPCSVSRNLSVLTLRGRQLPAVADALITYIQHELR